MSMLNYVSDELKEKYKKPKRRSRTSIESYCEKNKRT